VKINPTRNCDEQAAGLYHQCAEKKEAVLGKCFALGKFKHGDCCHECVMNFSPDSK